MPEPSSDTVVPLTVPETVTAPALVVVPAQVIETVAPCSKPLPWIGSWLPPSQTVPGTTESTFGGGSSLSSLTTTDWPGLGIVVPLAR